MDYIISDMVGACVASTSEEMECVEKFMTGFRIDGRTIKRGKLVYRSVI